MKISKILTSLFLLVALPSLAQLTPEDTLVRYFYQYPQQAIKQAEEMHEEAVRNHDNILLLKSLILRNTFTLHINREKYPSLLEQLESCIEKEKDSVILSILHSYAGQLYTQYYNYQSYLIDQRTPVEGYTPRNMEEWTRNLFMEKIFGHFLASLAPQQILQNTPVSGYQELLIGEVSKDSLRPTLYDFLCHRAIDLLPASYYPPDPALAHLPSLLAPTSVFVSTPIPVIPLNGPSNILNIWQKLLAFRLQASPLQALVVADLERLTYAGRIYRQSNQDSLCLATLQEMRKSYASLPVSVEIIAQEAALLAGRQSLDAKQQALALCEEGIRQYPHYPRINLLHQIISDIQAPDLTIRFPQIIYPGEKTDLQVRSKNIQTMTLEIYRIDTSWLAYSLAKREEKSSVPQTRLYKYTYSLPSRLVFSDTTFQMALLPPGFYKMVIQTPGAKEKISHEILCTRLFNTQQSINKQLLFSVNDWESGKPIPQATIYIYKRQNSKFQLLDSGYTNAQGKARFAQKGDYYQVVNSENPQGKINRISYHPQSVTPSAYTDLITDRKIYQPGQTVYYKGIAWTAGIDTMFLEKGKEYTVSLLHNRQDIASQKVKTNAFGSFTGSFVLPTNLMNGNFLLTTGSGYCNITVADYKRPEFEITFEETRRPYYIGDTIRIRGKIQSLSGIPLAQVSLQYQITQQNRFYGPVKAAPAQQGLSHTDTHGNFEFSFVAEAPELTPVFRHSFVYQVTVTATDPKGETQQSSTLVPVYPGQVNPILQVPEQVNKTVPTAFKISLQNLPSDTGRKKVNYTLSRLAAPEKPIYPFRLKDTLVEAIVLQGQLYIGQKDSIIPSLSTQPSGIYLLEAECGQQKSEAIFYLYSPRDKKPPFPTYNWTVQLKDQCRPGETARILFGSSVKNAYITYQVFSNQKLLQQKNVILSNGILEIEIPYKAEYGNEIWLYICYVKDKNFIEQIVPIQRIQDERTLMVRTEVFRDKLHPGQEEQWKIRVLHSNGQPAKAEVLAMMYDASLDQLLHYSVSFSPHYIKTFFPSRQTYGNYYSEGYLGLSSWLFKRKNYPVVPYHFAQLNLFELQGIYWDMGAGEEQVLYSKAQPNAIVRGYSSLQKESALSTGALDEGSGNALPVIPFRQNFQETAFFYPQLHTDSAGITEIRFTMPESTTRWKFTTLAYTENLAVGNLVKYVTTSKSLMVRPNLPRFLRSGDQAEIKVTISNLTDSVQSGQATLELFTPLGQQVTFTQSLPFRIPAKGSETLTFKLEVPQQTDLTGCRISAASSSFSDGEQHLLPILPDEVVVTSTLPFYSTRQGTHIYSLSRSSATQKDYRLTLEATTNPIWYAVLALPSLQQPVSDDAIHLAAAYYVNTLAAKIARSNPGIIKAIQTWKSAPGSSNTLLSKLEQNSELKSILLSATPWVMQAQNETEMMQMLSNLFDMNQLHYLQNQSLEKLSALQTSSGGWSWFKDMPASRTMTLSILQMLNRASVTGEKEYTASEKNMQFKALQYIDREIKNDFKDKPKRIGYDQIFYLYVRSLYTDIPLGEALEAHKHFMALAQKQWPEFSLYEKALTAITFQHYGFTTEARQILRSLKEYSETSEELGMYWPTNQHTYFRYSAISVQTAILEAFYKTEGNTADTEQMKLWLLRQKQTQLWESTMATVDAIYALLLTGKDQLSAGDKITLQLGKHQLSAPSGSDPLGYIKTSYPAEEIKPDMLTVKLTKTTDTPTWGGLYLQYSDKLGQIKKQQGELSVDKKLFIEHSSNGRQTLVPLEGKDLQVGDKIVVRLTFSLKRDMDFLHLKDMRAACFEPVEQISGNHWKFGTVYYQEVKDAVTNFFFNRLQRGTYVIEYPVWINQAGTYQDGIATFQSLYAPEYNAISNAGVVKVKE